MIKLKDLKEQAINEAVYGRNAVVFHRTSVSDLINKVYSEGFKSSGGDIYGKGFYSTYELSAQEKEFMKASYGPIICKFNVTIDNFISFDWEPFKLSPLGRSLKYDKYDFIITQLDHFDFDYDVNKILEFINKNSKSGDIALWCVNNISGFTKKVDGLIYTNSQDGQCLVCYKPNLLIPMSYKIDGVNEWVKVDRNLTYLKKVFNDREKLATGKDKHQ